MLLDAPAPTLAALLVALVTDALLGEPDWLYHRVPHPAVLIGHGISRLERRLLRAGSSPPRATCLGVLLLAVVVAAALMLGTMLAAAARLLPAGWLAEGLLMSTLLAQRSLAQHVAAVAPRPARRPRRGAPRRGDDRRPRPRPARRRRGQPRRRRIRWQRTCPTASSRRCSGAPSPVCPACLPTRPSTRWTAWSATATSATARSAGPAPAATTSSTSSPPGSPASLLCLAGGATATVATAMLRDAPHHRSPNAGWPEAAMAAALGLRSPGPRGLRRRPCAGRLDGGRPQRADRRRHPARARPRLADVVADRRPAGGRDARRPARS